MKHWGNLSLNDREGGDLQLNKDHCISKFSIAAKFLTKWAINTESVVRTFNTIWRSVNGFKVRNARIILSCLLLIMKRRLKKYLKANHGVLTNIW